jgi:hypothetical protein
LKTAIKEGKQIYIFIEKNVLSEFETYLLNKESKVKYRFVDDNRIYKFIEEIKNLGTNNNIKGFESANDIVKYLKEQFAGLFQRFLSEQVRINEISLITNLEKTAQTLNKLVNFLSDENKDKTGEINRILTINHPILDPLREKLGISYNFYVEGIDDLQSLLKARGFKKFETDPDGIDGIYFNWELELNNKFKRISIDSTLFESDGKLKFIKKSEWNDKYFKYIEIQKKSEEDDLPF